MPRPRNETGAVGAVHFTTLTNGRVTARTRIRDDSGHIHQLARTAASQDQALTQLLNVAAKLSSGVEPLLSATSTVAEACAVWLEELRVSQRVEDSTRESYMNTVEKIVVPVCGALRLEELSVGRCDRIIQRLLADRSISAARKARSVLSMVCGSAVRQDVMVRNPIRDVQRLPSSPKKTTALTGQQVAVVRELIHSWRLSEPAYGPRPDVQKLEDGMDIMLGTSGRIGEVLALRRMDVDVTVAPPTVLIAATMVSTKQNGTIRKPAPKRARQKRRVAVPSFAAAALRRRLAQTGTEQDAYLFATRTGRPYSVSNYERLLRTFVDDNQAALVAAGIETAEFSPHLFRRTVATLVEQSAGITLASRLLGHSSEATTRASYVVTAEQVDPVTAEILDGVLGAED